MSNVVLLKALYCAWCAKRLGVVSKEEGGDFIICCDSHCFSQAHMVSGKVGQHD